MERYDAERMERSTRDIVARSSFLEIQAGRGSPNNGVFIDVSHLGAEFIETNFPGMVKRCRDMGFDLVRKPVEVSPTAHFIMGGVRIDQYTRSGLEGLFVAGEDAGGVHGANRLGGNGVAESTVFGCVVGDFVSTLLPPLRAVSDAQFQKIVTEALGPFDRNGVEKGNERVVDLKVEMQTLMWENVGLVRSGLELREAIEKLSVLRERLDRVYVRPLKRYNLEWQEYLNLRNFLDVSRLVAISALTREESRGSHFRLDFPFADDQRFLQNIYINGKGEVELRPVKLTRLQKPS
jgi:succinate dehydrogenase / fumarate reductase flavoprotein subunit/fumarate reductase flavoprotein subunit